MGMEKPVAQQPPPPPPLVRDELEEVRGTERLPTVGEELKRMKERVNRKRDIEDARPVGEFGPVPRDRGVPPTFDQGVG